MGEKSFRHKFTRRAKIVAALAVTFFSLSENTDAQPGCTDPQAANFDAAATLNDGSCEYPTTVFQPEEIAPLPPDLVECSGLAFFGGQLWTQLDGGNPDQLFTLDTTTAAKLGTVTIPNADNHDWEDMAEDEAHLYIGDFGNNFGDRTDLRIYKIKKADLLAGTASPELIEFSFSDQTNFMYEQNMHNFDCEAFFVWQDSLHLFSKNWADFKTRHYVLPTSPGAHIAGLRDSLDTGGQITGADISEDGTAVLIGYNVSTGEPFLWLLFDFPGSSFFKGNKRKISLGSILDISQLEGVVFRDSTRGYICSEKFSVLPQRLLRFNLREFLENPVSATVRTGRPMAALSIFPNPAGDWLNLNLGKWPPNNEIALAIVDSAGKICHRGNLKKSESGNFVQLDISHLRSGNYEVVLTSGHIRKTARLAKF